MGYRSRRRDHSAELKSTLALFEAVGPQCLGTEAYLELSSSDLFTNHFLGAMGHLELMANSFEDDIESLREDFRRNASKVREAYWSFEEALQEGEPSALCAYGLEGLAQGKLLEHLAGFLTHLELLGEGNPTDSLLPMGFKVAGAMAAAAAKLSEAACTTLAPLREAETWQDGIAALLLEALQAPLQEHIENLERQRLLSNYRKLVQAALEEKTRRTPYEGQEPLPGTSPRPASSTLSLFPLAA